MEILSNISFERQTLSPENPRHDHVTDAARTSAQTGQLLSNALPVSCHIWFTFQKVSPRPPRGLVKA